MGGRRRGNMDGSAEQLWAERPWTAMLRAWRGPAKRQLPVVSCQPFDRPFDKLRVPSNVEGLTALSMAEGLSVASCQRTAGRRRQLRRTVRSDTPPAKTPRTAAALGPRVTTAVP